MRVSYKLLSLISLISKRSPTFKVFLESKDAEVEALHRSGATGIELPHPSGMISAISGSSMTRVDVAVYCLLRYILRSVEICNSKDQLMTILFPKLPEFFLLSKQSKLRFEERCNRESAETKIESMMDALDTFEMEIKFNVKTWEHNKFLYQIFARDLKRFEMMALGIALVKNYLILTDFHVEENRPIAEYQELVVILSLIQIVYCFLYLIFGLKVRFTLTYFSARKAYLKQMLDAEAKLGVFDHLYILISAIMNHDQIIVFLFHLGCSTCGLFFSKAFYALELLSVINLSKMFKKFATILRSKGKQISFVLLISLLLIYVYGMFAFLYFRTAFEEREVRGGEKEHLCDNFHRCFFTVLDYGLRSGGGVGEIMAMESFHESNRARFYSRMFFNISFYILINIISINIIFGIIIDTFSDLRDKTSSYEYDTENVCFICSIDKWEFLRHSLSFTEHKKKEHNMWNYIFWMLYLRTKGPKDMVGLESYVNRKIVSNDYSWLPLKKALTLEEAKRGLAAERLSLIHI
eukprot:TRINITY_DN3245_c0_g1_i1.p1 TRINITY_DN3245_c0_g1~~TRINITY_DN3245_c0_g1_i1.p1  ORF type:complete len:523 (-),score=138.23 TRINITY_DN3245_c0_g1_i1:61-1629(-)